MKTKLYKIFFLTVIVILDLFLPTKVSAECWNGVSWGPTPNFPPESCINTSYGGSYGVTIYSCSTNYIGYEGQNACYYHSYICDAPCYEPGGGGGSWNGYTFPTCAAGEVLTCGSPPVMQCVKYIGSCGALFPSAWIGDTYNGVYDCSGGGSNQINYCQTNCNCSQPTLSCSNLVNSSVSPSTVPSGGGQLVNVGCNFGDGDYPCIQASINGSSCNFQNWTGTTANFSCAAPATAGSYNISCDLVNNATYCPNQTPYNCPGVALVVERSCTTTAPTNPTVTNITTSSARLNWTPGTGGGSQLFRFDTSEYKVENGCPGGCMVSTTLDSGVNFYDISGLSPNTIYYWRVVEYLDSSDWTDFGNQCLVSTSGSVFFTTSSTPVSSWWQVKDGDITTLGSIQSAVYTTNFFNLDGLGGFPGIPVYGTGQTLSFAPGGLSSTNWRAETDTVTSRLFNYSYFNNLIPTTATINDIALLSSGGVATGDYEWFKVTGNTSIDSALNVGNRKVILFVDGNLSINSNINLTDNLGFLGIFVSGNITVSPTVTSLEGVYLTNGIFNTGSPSTDQLYVRGSVVAYSGITLARNGLVDNSIPSEVFEFAPDQILLFPTDKLGYKTQKWAEVAP